MTKDQWLLLVTFALSCYGTGQVWLVQLSSYRLWSYVGKNEFRAYHLAWWHGIWGVILAPACLVSLGAVLMLWWRALASALDDMGRIGAADFPDSRDGPVVGALDGAYRCPRRRTPAPTLPPADGDALAPGLHHHRIP